MPWACSVMIWGGLAYLIRDWRWLLFTTSITGVFIIPVLWFIDESPRWLAVKGHHERALKVLKKAARWNRATLPPDDTALQILKESRDDGIPTRDKLRHKGLKEVIIEKMKETAILFRTPKLRRITCILYVDYLIVNFVYYGLSLNGGNLSDDPFLFMALSGLMEVPAYSLPVPIVSRFGRRVPGSVSFLLSGVTLLAVSPLPKRYGWLIMTLAMIGKVTISTAFQVLIFYSSELFPTEVRSRGIGTCFMVSRIGSIVSPFITEILGSSFPWAPSLLFGACSVIASIALLTLPETSGIALPDTITQLEQRQDKVRSWKFFRSAERKVNESEDRKESTDPL
ncbi:organic cation transporter protein-like [Palaemon carinicauda]|uniref:organic cation transporter protein-like n=1 Tax=Palaemon carinicauda TaxID=392227 RepID=UPI0035B6661B